MGIVQKLRAVSFSTKLFFTFITLSLMVAGILQLHSWYYGLKEDVHKQEATTQLLKNDFSNWMLNIYIFLNKEPIDTAFFINNTSKNFQESKILLSQMQTKINELEGNFGQIEVRNLLANISRNLTNMDQLQNELKLLIIKRGFKNHGLEGQMRKAVHEVENNLSDLVRPSDYLMLRRHEKDYILRKDEFYVEKLVDLNQVILKKLKEVNTPEAFVAIQKLEQYENRFLELVQIEKKIGSLGDVGLMAQMELSMELADKEVSALQVLIPKLSKSEIQKIEFGYYSAWVLFIFICVVGSWWISKFFTWRIKMLSQYISDFVNSNFTYKKKLPFSKSQDEIGLLYRNFSVLQDEIAIHFDHYKKKVEKRTQEILSQNRKIQSQHDKIETQRDLLNNRNKEVMESIRYAERIQRSILLKEDRLHKLFDNHFIILKPKDIVSGDFYWGRKIGKRIFFAVADCTGHGVPGAFMSIIGHNLLTYALNDRKLREPNEVLKLLNQLIRKTLNQDDEIESMKDGMDIAFFSYDTDTRELKFSGAQRPLLILGKGELIELKGDRFPVGGSLVNDTTEFSQQSIFLNEGDTIYAFSDGFVDQFGGKNDKKFKYKPFKSLLNSIHTENEQKQKELLLEAFIMWKGINPQIDDVCVFGARV